MNELAKFPPKNEPPSDLLIWWENGGSRKVADQWRRPGRWHIWFDKCPPMFADADYNSFRQKTFHFQKVDESMVRATVHTGDVQTGMDILKSYGARILAYSLKVNTVTIEIADEAFYNMFRLYPNFTGLQKVKGPYEQSFDFIELN